MRQVFFLLVIATLILCGCSKEDEKGRGNISGVIVDARGEPIKAAMIAVFAGKEAEIYFNWYNDWDSDEPAPKEPSALYTSSTGSDGYYMLQDIDVGEYIVYADKAGYEDVNYSVSVRKNKTTQIDITLWYYE